MKLVLPVDLQICPIDAEATYPLRHRVLWPDKPLDFVKVEADAEGHHLGAFVDNSLIAVISLFVTGTDARFRKFATHPDWQRRSIGSALLTQTLAQARQLGATSVWCDARLDAADFYRRFNLLPEGDIFYKGPIPYVRMWGAL